MKIINSSKKVIIFLLISWLIMVLVLFFFYYLKQKGDERSDLMSKDRSREVYNFDNDHTLGNKNAPYVMIIYSDTECPYCKQMHEDMLQLHKNYNNLLIVYRHNPLTHRFEKSLTEAKALECVAKIKGESAFWEYLDAIYKNTNSNDSLEYSQLLLMGSSNKQEESVLENCITTDSDVEYKVRMDKNKALSSNASITPSAILLSTKNMDAILIEAVTYRKVARVLESLIKIE